MKISPNYKLVYEIANGLIALEQLDRYELVSVAIVDENKYDIDFSLYKDIVLTAQSMCVERLKDILEDEYNAKLDAMPQWWKDDMNALGYDTVEDDGRDKGD